MNTHRLMPVALLPAIKDAIVETGGCFQPESLWAAIIAAFDQVRPPLTHDHPLLAAQREALGIAHDAARPAPIQSGDVRNQALEEAADALDDAGAKLQTEDKSHDFWMGVGAAVQAGEIAIRALASTPSAAMQGQGVPEGHACGACNGSGWVVRDEDIGTDQECFCCGGSGRCEDDPSEAPNDPAPETDLPNWSECNRIIENYEFRIRAKAGLEGQVLDTPPTSPDPTELHRFIYEYDDADNYKSGWFMYRLARVMHEAAQPQAGGRELTDADNRHLDIGKAVERACGELPEGYELLLELEHDSGTVRLCFPDTDITEDDFDDRDSFAGKINSAIDCALAAHITGTKGATE